MSRLRIEVDLEEAQSFVRELPGFGAGVADITIAIEKTLARLGREGCGAVLTARIPELLVGLALVRVARG